MQEVEVPVVLEIFSIQSPTACTHAGVIPRNGLEVLILLLQLSITVTATAFPITVGAGGAGTSWNQVDGA